MKIIIKQLQGQELTLEVKGDTRVSEVKAKIADLLRTPVSHQKLLLTGRPLKDESCICDYPTIKEGSKLNLVVNQITTTKRKIDLESFDTCSVTQMQDALHKFLREFNTEVDPRRIVEEFGKEFEDLMSSMNLEDYERMATLFLEEEGAS